jgi:hypothetical protein
MNVGIGTRAVPVLGICVSNFRYCVFAVYSIYSIKQSEEDISPHVSPPNDGYFCPWQDTVIMIHPGFPYECHRQKMYEHVHVLVYSMLLVIEHHRQERR